MELKELTLEHVQTMVKQKARKIYLVDFSEAYMEELFGKYNLAEHIAGILSDVEDRISGSIKRGSKAVSFNGMEVPVYPYKDFCRLRDEAYFIILNDYFKETYEKLTALGSGIEKRRDVIYYFANYETETDLYYRNKYKDVSLENVIIFRSGPHASAYIKGMDFADNARALFEYMLDRQYNEKYKLVWFVKNPEDFRHYETYKNVEFLSFDWSVSEKKEERDRYYRALCLAKYIFFTDAYGFCRNARKDQVRVQLWHGCGFKTRVNFVRCEKRYEYHIVISEIYRKIHSKIYGLREDQVIVTGYPKNDWLFRPDQDWREKLEIPAAGHYIFWLPTFRTPIGKLEALSEKAPKGQTGLPVVCKTKELQYLNDILRKEDTVLIVKLHPFQDSEAIYCKGMSNIILMDNEKMSEKDVQVNQILGNADGLISDYSSVAVDYMLLDRPIGFTVDDIEEYGESRGFVFENVREWMPGKEIVTFSDFCSFIRETIANAETPEKFRVNTDSTKRRRRELRDKMHQYKDMQSCERVLEKLKIENKIQ